ncbi:MarR family transcriptional regulator [Demequina sp.]|uniref:GbsR/MarR family transcriptional regulator n=1 Tax=Demequina sp. TaxID=2050685 RepID=UPI0025BA2503|nr:MarR family transcriptional regulator [Demequina sp.]
MTSSRRTSAHDAFAAEAAQFWEYAGMSRAAGAILGHLMVCEPAAQTQAELASALRLSSGAVSTQLQALITSGLVERVRRLGVRTQFYQLPEGVWLKLMGSEDVRIAKLRAVSDAGLAALPATRQDRITTLDLMVRFFEAEWPRVMERFDEFMRKEGS